MILIFFSWIILFYFFITFGVTTEFLLKSNSKNALTVIFGMVSQTILLTVSAFFTSIGAEFFIANFILTTILAVIFKKDISNVLKTFLSDFKNLAQYSKIILGIILFSALLKCAQSPFILDNESYYIQTIKWLNEYGFVKGLANLNIAFGQTSGWHILQSGFNFSFLTDRINDINGFLLAICSFYFVSIFDTKYKAEKQFHWVGFIVLFNALSFQFINSPSPDIPLFLIAQIMFYLFLKENKTIEDIKTIILLFVFLCFIKITIAPLGLLLLFLFYKEQKGIVFCFIISLTFGILWMAKNIILTGYPLYPFDYLSIRTDWSVPVKLVENINNMIKNHEFLQIKNYKSLSVFEKFMIWIRFGGINSIFNKGIILLFLLVPFVKKIRTITRYKVLYLVLLVHFIFVFIISPQFRFFLAEFIFLASLLLSEIINRLKINYRIVNYGLISAVILPLFLIYFIDLKSLTDNKLNQDSEKISWKQVYLPEKNSKYGDMTFIKVKKGNLEYYSPRINFFIYGTADGPLPCVNKNELNYFEQKLKIIPQLRSNSIKDGFYSKETDL